ncbi:MAG: DUF3048 domain-containing protein [Actinomycetota bacterium]|nr:DUF3048 domain-containing protein [Actinomycetota bacterium]MDA3005996.1 DUF3048 domain-containing protein [Actinomycetota bacterium]MDA3035314.1 DUF3048 domain-containing protein [Actinomycetota bacterium]
MTSITRTAASFVAVGLLALTACGGEGADDILDAVSDAVDDLTSTTVPDADEDVAGGTTTTPSTAAPGDDAVVEVEFSEPEFRMPLTGEPLEVAEMIPDRPALVVKVPNNSQALPQTGLNEADIVYEEIINDAITRFAVVFHSQGSDPVGPIRSGRAQDIDLLTNLNSPLFAWSGGNAGVTRLVNNSSLVSLSYVGGYANAYYRRDGRGGAPHNLFSSTDTLWAEAPDDASTPPQLFQYLREGEMIDADTASVVEIEMDSIAVRWEFDEDTGQYLRWQNGEEHPTELTGQVSADNVVVLFVEYRSGVVDARSPEAQTVGSGDALVFTGGTVQPAVWARESNTDPIGLFTDASATTPVRLSPGRTWVELPRNDPSDVMYVS